MTIFIIFFCRQRLLFLRHEAAELRAAKMVHSEQPIGPTPGYHRIRTSAGRPDAG